MNSTFEVVNFYVAQITFLQVFNGKGVAWRIHGVGAGVVLLSSISLLLVGIGLLLFGVTCALLGTHFFSTGFCCAGTGVGVGLITNSSALLSDLVSTKNNAYGVIQFYRKMFT